MIDDNVRNNKMVVMSNNNGCLWDVSSISAFR